MACGLYGRNKSLRRAFSGVVLMLLLVGIFASAFIIQPAKANETIYIRADGSIDPPTAPISTVDNVTYILTGNITSDANGIVAERSSIIIDGNGFALQGSGSGTGIYLSGIENVTVQNSIIMNNLIGIYAEKSNNNTFRNNIFANNVGPPWKVVYDPGTGQMKLVGSKNDVSLHLCNDSNVLDNQCVVRLENSSANTIRNCSEAYLSFSDGNAVDGCDDSVSLKSSDKNTITNCTCGIKLEESNDNSICNNSFQGESIELALQSNTGKTPGCNRNQVVGCTLVDGNIFVGQCQSSGYGVTSNDNMIANNIIVGGSISVFGSNNTVTENRISKTDVAVQIYYAFTQDPTGNNTISRNELTNGTVGLDVGTANNTVNENTIRFNELGIRLLSSNSLSNNVIKNNDYGLYIKSEKNTLRNNQISQNEWSLITGAMGDEDIDATNTINGDPIYYLVNQNGIEIEPSTFPRIGYLGLVNCSNITLRDAVLTTRNGEGIKLIRCTNCTVERTTIKNTCVAILSQSDNTTISQNTIQENYQGMRLEGDRNRIENNTVTNNTIRLAPYRWPDDWYNSSYSPFHDWLMDDDLLWYSGGIWMMGITNSTISGNSLTHNEQGILMYQSSFNTFRNNSMADNFHNFGLDFWTLWPPEWVFHPPSPDETSPYLMNDVDPTNTINGKPIYWWINRRDEQVPTDAGYLILVNSTDMVVRDLQLQNNVQGMLLIGVNNTVIFNNTITGSSYGIRILPTFYGNSFNDTLSYNNITANGVAFSIDSLNCTVSNNIVDSNVIGIDTLNDYNLIIENNITNNSLPPREAWILGYDLPYLANAVRYYREGNGIILDSSNNTVCYNLIQNNECGIGPGGLIYMRSGDNLIYHNNFVNNTLQTSLASVYRWDDGYPSGGNYWSSYSGEDANSGQFQNQTGSDGIGDEPYRATQDIAANQFLTPDARERLWNQYDSYPLMAPINIWHIKTWNNTSQSVDVESNSSVTEFYFNPSIDEPFISFNVSGQSDTTGFCRMSISTTLMNDTFHVFVNGTEVQYFRLSCPDADCNYLYFTYTHSTEGVIITPEFPSFLVLALFMMTVLAVVMAYKRKRS
jgi:parallel beta-helix repeat protein